MIIIPSMPTRFRPLPQLEIQLNLPELRALAFVLDRVLSLRLGNKFKTVKDAVKHAVDALSK